MQLRTKRRDWMEKYFKPISELIKYDQCEDILTASTEKNSDDLFTGDEYNADNEY